MFSSNDYSLRASLGGCVPPFCGHRAFPTAIMACTITPWVSDTVAGCLPSFGLIEGGLTVLTAALQQSSLSESFSYDLWPVAYPGSQTNPGKETNGAPYSQANSTLFAMGRNLGEGPLSQAARVGGSHCESTTWMSSSTLRCKTSSGVGRVYPITATIESKYDAIATACNAL